MLTIDNCLMPCTCFLHSMWAYSRDVHKSCHSLCIPYLHPSCIPFFHFCRSLICIPLVSLFFIFAGLTENRCLSKRPTGATLLQVGEQDVAFGAKFRARVVLNIEEHIEGAPQRLCSNHHGSSSTSSADEQLFPLPRAPPCDGTCRDVCFSLIEGDFQVSLWSSVLQQQQKTSQ